MSDQIVYVSVRTSTFEGEEMEKDILGVYSSNPLAWARNDVVKAESHCEGQFYTVVPTVLDADIYYDK